MATIPGPDATGYVFVGSDLTRTCGIEPSRQEERDPQLLVRPRHGPGRIGNRGQGMAKQFRQPNLAQVLCTNPPVGGRWAGGAQAVVVANHTRTMLDYLLEHRKMVMTICLCMLQMVGGRHVR